MHDSAAVPRQRECQVLVIDFILEKNKKHNFDGKRDLSQHTVEVQAVGFGAAGESLRHVVFFQFV